MNIEIRKTEDPKTVLEELDYSADGPPVYETQRVAEQPIRELPNWPFFVWPWMIWAAIIIAAVVINVGFLAADHAISVAAR
ncbi:MAG: hypothetical protein QM758_09505 [Armatimonas sp.]